MKMAGMEYKNSREAGTTRAGWRPRSLPRYGVVIVALVVPTRIGYS